MSSPNKLLKTEPEIRSSELIEMIKMKLYEGGGSKKRMKTEQNQRGEVYNHRYLKKNREVQSNVVKGVHLRKGRKGKKIDLSVTNTKFDLKPRDLHQEKVQEVVVALNKRPCSASPVREVVKFTEEMRVRQKKSMFPTSQVPKESKIVKKSVFN